MEENNRSGSRRGTTKLTPPKKDKTDNLSRDEVRSINKVKNSRKRKLKRIAMLCVFGVGVICAGIALVLTVFFRIDSIKITGERLYGDKEIISYCGVEYGDNLFFVNEKKMNESLCGAMPYIKSVTVERKLPDTLIINVVSAEAAAAVPCGNAYVVIDSDGKILDKDAGDAEGIAIVSGLDVKEPVEGEQITVNGDGNTEDLLEITRAVRDSGIERITEINFIKKGVFELKYDGRILLELGSMLNVCDKLKRANGAIEQKNSNDAYFVGTFNLSVEPKVFESPGDKYAEEIDEVTDENGDLIPTEDTAVSGSDETSEDTES